MVRWSVLNQVQQLQHVEEAEFMEVLLNHPWCLSQCRWSRVQRLWWRLQGGSLGCLGLTWIVQCHRNPIREIRLLILLLHNLLISIHSQMSVMACRYLVGGWTREKDRHQAQILVFERFKAFRMKRSLSERSCNRGILPFNKEQCSIQPNLWGKFGWSSISVLVKTEAQRNDHQIVHVQMIISLKNLPQFVIRRVRWVPLLGYIDDWRGSVSLGIWMDNILANLRYELACIAQFYLIDGIDLHYVYYISLSCQGFHAPNSKFFSMLFLLRILFILLLSPSPTVPPTGRSPYCQVKVGRGRSSSLWTRLGCTHWHLRLER